MTAELDFSADDADSAHFGTSPNGTFESFDPDKVRCHLTELLGPHAMDLPDGARGFRGRQRATSVAGMRVHRMTFGGTSVDLRPEPSDDHIVVVQPLHGVIGISSGPIGVVASPRVPVVLDAGKRYRTHWRKDTVTYKIVVDRSLALGLAAELHGLSAEEVALDFALQPPPSAQAIATWGRVVALLAAQESTTAPGLLSTLTEFHLAKAAVSALLDLFPTAARAMGDERPAVTPPAPIDHAISYIEEHAQDPITLGDIAQSAGLSPRALQAAFRRHRDVTPMEYARQIRLRRAYDDLITADFGSTTVASVATRWGYHNPGRFASEFRSTFGKYPREALEQSR